MRADLTWYQSAADTHFHESTAARFGVSKEGEVVAWELSYLYNKRPVLSSISMLWGTITPLRGTITDSLLSPFDLKELEREDRLSILNSPAFRHTLSEMHLHKWTEKFTAWPQFRSQIEFWGTLMERILSMPPPDHRKQFPMYTVLDGVRKTQPSEHVYTIVTMNRYGRAHILLPGESQEESCRAFIINPLAE